jgi:outer membrane protein, heavy metal efflux system
MRYLDAMRNALWPLTLLCAWPFGAPAQPASHEHAEHGPQEHAPIDVDRGLAWDTVLARALVHYPQYVELEAREREADALRRRARSWFASRPSVMLGYRSDSPLDNYGLAEYDTMLNLPLWRFGERRAAGIIGERAAGGAAAAQAALRWEVAGALREVLWNIESAVNGIELAGEALDVAADIERIVARRHEVGDLPLEDALLAQTEVLERRTALIERQAELVDAEFAYELLTMLPARPPAFVEAVPERRVLASSHPLLALAEAELELARAQLELTAREAKGAPTLSIGPRRQRDPLTPFFTDSVGVEMTVPFGGEAHMDAATAAAHRRVTEAQARRSMMERRLHADLHEALHSLDTAESALALAEERAELAERHRRMGQTAFEQGEIALLDLLRRNESALRAAREARALEVLRGRSLAAANQALGVLP